MLSKDVEVFVDGHAYMVDSTMTVFQAVQKSGTTVPRFCFHERLAVAGNCRMCLVDVEKAPKPTASCAAPVMPGMVINTKTPRA
jgi:NADH dehydrogenase (ubiquinone) Fe-S protein 1